MIQVYVVTYKKNDVLNENLRTLWAATRRPGEISVTVISNHPDVVIDVENERPNLRVLINATRAANSWGYLARDWNFGILDAFKNWRNPDATEWCVLAQNDLTWVDGWDDYLRACDRFDLISQPRGDQAIALNLAAARAVGFFDERFCTLHFQEFDYFFRAMLALGDRASINDDHGGSEALASWNPVGCVLTENSASGLDTAPDSLFHTPKTWREMRNLLFHKWGVGSLEIVEHKARLVEYVQNRPDRARPAEVNWYPFFWDGDPDLAPGRFSPAYDDLTDAAPALPDDPAAPYLSDLIRTHRLQRGVGTGERNTDSLTEAFAATGGSFHRFDQARPLSAYRVGLLLSDGPETVNLFVWDNDTAQGGGDLDDAPLADFLCITHFLAPVCAVVFRGKSDSVARAVAEAERRLKTRAITQSVEGGGLMTVIGRGLTGDYAAPAALPAPPAPTLDQISVVVQGPITGSPDDSPEKRLTQKCLQNLRRDLPGAELILSTWRGADTRGLDFDVLVESDDPGGLCYHNGLMDGRRILNNVNRQIVTTRNGLMRATRPYALKIRTDFWLEGRAFLEFWEQFPRRGEAWRVLEERVLNCTVYARNPRRHLPFAYHPSDWVFFGRREDVLAIWNIPLAPEPETSRWFDDKPRPARDPYPNATNRYTPEQYIWTAFLRKHAPLHLDHQFEVSRAIIEGSEQSIANNLVLLEPGQWGLKFERSPIPPFDLASLYTHGDWQRLYNRWGGGSLTPPPDLRRLNRTVRWRREKLRLVIVNPNLLAREGVAQICRVAQNGPPLTAVPYRFARRLYRRLRGRTDLDTPRP